MVQFGKLSHHLLLFFISLLSSSSTVLSATIREGEALVEWKNSLSPNSFLGSWSLINLTYLCN